MAALFPRLDPAEAFVCGKILPEGVSWASDQTCPFVLNSTDCGMNARGHHLVSRERRYPGSYARYAIEDGVGRRIFSHAHYELFKVKWSNEGRVCSDVFEQFQPILIHNHVYHVDDVHPSGAVKTWDAELLNQRGEKIMLNKSGFSGTAHVKDYSRVKI